MHLYRLFHPKRFQTFISHTLKSRGLYSVFETESKLLRQLRAKIEATGPITVADYMKETLISPHVGYYMKNDVFGERGDFITSPEISQIFGELIGIWFCNEWLKIGQPKPLQFVEFGPGRGTLADDVLRVFSKFLPSDKVNLSVQLIELSPYMRDLQRKKLCKTNGEPASNSETVESGRIFLTKHGYPLQFHDHLEQVPEGFSLFLAHEFFDALPIHKFQKYEEDWKEILIDYRHGKFHFVASRNPTPAAKYLIDPNEVRDHVEICPEAGILIESICKRMKEDGGITLIIDYGHDGTKTDTFRGFKKHELHNPLENPGEADLTADVDFSYLRRHVKDEGYFVGPVSQSHFLKNMGIDFRLAKLMENASPEVQESLKSGCEMLLNKMGGLFKVSAIYPTVLEEILKKYPPTGF